MCPKQNKLVDIKYTNFNQFKDIFYDIISMHLFCKCFHFICINYATYKLISSVSFQRQIIVKYFQSHQNEKHTSFTRQEIMKQHILPCVLSALGIDAIRNVVIYLLVMNSCFHTRKECQRKVQHKCNFHSFFALSIC